MAHDRDQPRPARRLIGPDIYRIRTVLDATPAAFAAMVQGGVRPAPGKVTAADVLAWEREGALPDPAWWRCLADLAEAACGRAPQLESSLRWGD